MGTTHTSLDVVLVSPFHPVAALSLCWNIQDPQIYKTHIQIYKTLKYTDKYTQTIHRQIYKTLKYTDKYTRPWNIQDPLCWNIQDPQMNYRLTLTGLWQTSKRKLTLMEAQNTKCGYLHTWNELMYFWHLNWGIQPFQCIQEKLPHTWNACWTQ